MALTTQTQIFLPGHSPCTLELGMYKICADICDLCNVGLHILFDTFSFTRTMIGLIMLIMV